MPLRKATSLSQNKSALQLTEEVQIKATIKKWQLFKNVVGNFFSGKIIMVGAVCSITTKKGSIPLSPGDRVLINPSTTKVGFPKGSPDLMGQRNIIITPAMVGLNLSVVVGVEIKTKNDKIGRDQIIYLLNGRINGGTYHVYHDGKFLSLDEILNLGRRTDKNAEVLDDMILVLTRKLNEQKAMA